MARQYPDDDQLQQDAMAEQFGIKNPAAPVRESVSDAPQSHGYTDPRTPEPWSEQVPQAPAPRATPQTFQGFQPKHAMEGFDFQREQNTGKSAKDAFAYFANQAPPPPLNDKAALGQWFDQYIAPGMNALGHKVSGPAQGDKFGFENWQGKFDVDFGRGAGADGGALAWQVDDGTAALSNGSYQPQTAQGIGAVRETPVNDDRTARILAEIDALINNGPSPMQQDSLAQLFGI